MRPSLLAAALAGALGATGMLATGCSSPEATAEIPVLFTTNLDSGAAVPPILADRADVLDAADLRLTLEELFGIHGVLAQGMMRAGGQERALDPWLEALASNNAELAGTVGLVFGPDAAHAFDQLWSYQAQFLLDYAAATDDGDRAAARAALAGLGDFGQDLPAMLVTASQGAVPADDLVRALDVHIRSQIQQYDSISRGALAEALAAQTDDRGALAEIAIVLARAIAVQQPAAFPGDVDDPRVTSGSSAALRMTAFVDGILDTLVAGGVVAWSDPLTRLATAAGLSVRGIDPFATDPAPLAELFLAGIESPTAEQDLDANDLATLTQRLSPADFVLGSVPPTLRAAYASAYRLARATVGH